MKVITFLGTGSYKPVSYQWQARSFQTDLFPEALASWLQPDEVIVFLTPEARTHANWSNLRARLAERGMPVRDVDIANGGSEEELWQIFTQLAETLVPGDEVIFDVTHGFRSLPILALLVSAYLRVAKGVQLRALVYGAFDAVPRGEPVPVFDLTPFVRLLDWVTATDRFVRAGDASDFADLLSEAHAAPYRKGGEADRSQLPQRLKTLGKELREFSRSLLLARPMEATDHASALGTLFNEATIEASRYARPLTLLLERMRQAAEAFAVPTLASQRSMIRWHLDHELVFPALTLMREWLVSWTCQQLHLERVEEHATAEQVLNQKAALSRQEAIRGEPSLLLERFEQLPGAELVIKAWNGIVEPRNDLAHCGFNRQPRSATQLLGTAREVYRSIAEIPSGASGTA